MLTLAKIAYGACSHEHQLWHNKVLKLSSIKMKNDCCIKLLNFDPTKEEFIEYDENICAVAAKHGHLDCLSYAHNLGFTYGNTIGKIADENGNSECLQYALKNGYIPDGDKNLWEEVSNYEDYDTIINSMYKKIFVNISSLEHCYYYNKFDDTLGRGLPMGYCITNIAAKNGLLDLLKLAHKNGSRWNVDNICDLAISSGHLNTMAYCHTNGCRLSVDTCTVATKLGYYDIVKYAHQNGYPLERNTCTLAASLGYCDILIYAHQNGCPLDRNTCLMAAKCENVKMLKYARENGCPWNNGATKFAAKNGILDIVLPKKSRIIPARKRYPIKRYPM